MLKRLVTIRIEEVLPCPLLYRLLIDRRQILVNREVDILKRLLLDLL